MKNQNSLGTEKLSALARQLGGSCTFPFSQGRAFVVADALERHSESHKDGRWNDQGKMYKMVLFGKQKGLGTQEEMGGVCATIASFWTVFHAKAEDGIQGFTRGRSVWDYLFDSQGNLNLGAAQNIVIEQHRSCGNQLNHIEAFMQKFNMVRRTKTTCGTELHMRFIPFTPASCMGCAKAIGQLNGYKLIQLKKTPNGSGSGHMVAAWYDGQDILFMDPNYGEFWLPNIQAFQQWLTQYRTNLYKKYCSMRVHTFVKQRVQAKGRRSGGPFGGLAGG